VTAVDLSGNSSSAASVSVLPPDVTPPKPVAAIVVTADTSKVKLDWASNTESDLAGYHVYRAATVDGEYVKLTATPRTSSDYSDTAAPIGVTSYYRVTAVDKTGNESTPVAASGVRRDSVAPATPKTLTATAADNGITLEWADNTDADLAGYVVSRSTTSTRKPAEDSRLQRNWPGRSGRPPFCCLSHAARAATQRSAAPSAGSPIGSCRSGSRNSNEMT
jgi:fibronectin type 3 domain-containing protein